MTHCGEDEHDQICVLGELQTCPCIGEGESIQECNEDLKGWGQCQCTMESSGGGTEDDVMENGGEVSAGEDSGATETAGEDSGGEDGGGEDSGGEDSGATEIAGEDMGGEVNGGEDSGATETAGEDMGGEFNGGEEVGNLVTIWSHTFNGTFGPGSGLQPGDMETQGSQGFSDGGSWISTGGWLSKSISTVGYRTIEVGYLLTKDETSTCNLNMSIDGGSTWTNVLSDSGPGGYRLSGILPTSAEGESRVLLRWTSETAWCWMNNIIITAYTTRGIDNDANNNEMEANDDANGMSSNTVFHIFLLMGQSNMVGCDVITPEDRISDERISVLGYETCSETSRVLNQWETASPPLHNCSKGIGPGDYFAKTLAEALPEGHSIGLVPTAVSGQWIETFLEGGIHHQNILDKIQIAAGMENARFSGIIFHQGESNSGDVTWPSKVQQLYTQVKAAMGIDYDIPFIAGEMLYGGSCAEHNSLVRQLPNLGDNFDYVSAEGLVMAPGDEWLVHFGHNSQVTLGTRYGEKMRTALGW